MSIRVYKRHFIAGLLSVILGTTYSFLSAQHQSIADSARGTDATPSLISPRDYEAGHAVYFADFSPDGRYIVTAGSDNHVIIRDAATGNVFRTLADIKKRTNVVAVSKDNQMLYTAGEDGAIYKWNPGSLDLLQSVKGNAGPVYALDLSPDEQYLVSGGKEGLIQLWNADDLTLITDLKRHDKRITALSFSHDGNTIIAGSADGTISRWDIHSKRLLGITDARKGWVRCLAYSPDDRFIASGGDDNLIHLWEAGRLQKTVSLEGHTNWVQCLDFSPDGNYLVSGGHDQQIILWDLNSLRPLQYSAGEDHILMSTRFSPDGNSLLSSCLLTETYQIRSMHKLQASGSKPSQILIGPTADKETPDTSGSGKIIPADGPVISILSPEFRMGRAVIDEPDVTLLGRVTDEKGVTAVMINKKPVELSDAGVFEFSLSLKKGMNDLDIMAVNTRGTLSRKHLQLECTAGPADNTEDVPEVYSGRYYALIIAVNEYDDPNIVDLDMPLKDAQSLYNTLIERYTFVPERINFLKNPTRAEIIMALDELSRIVTEKDNLLIFYAGHGHWDEDGKIGYWLPRDAMKSSTANWVRNSTMRDFIGSIKSKHTILIADACFSGSIFKTRTAFSEPPGGIRKLYNLSSRKAMTSGTLELVPDESVFLKYLIKRLEENQQKFLPSESLYSELKSAVLNNSPNIPQYGTIQNVGDEGGDFIFILK